MDSFRYYLLAFQIMCSLCDIHLAFMMQAVTLFPVVGGYCLGALAMYFDVSPHFLMAMLTFIVGFQVNALNLCFLKKHQSISRISNKYILTERTYNLIVFFFLSYTFSYTIPFYLASYSKEEQHRIIDLRYPTLRSKFERLPNFEVYELNNRIIIFVSLLSCGCIQSLTTVSVQVYQMYQVLVHCSFNLSKATLEKHKSAVKSLVGQFLTTPIAIFPGMMIVSTLFIQFEGAQVFTWYMLMSMTTHSTINCLVVIFTYREFRKFVLFWTKEAKLRRNQNNVNLIPNSNGSVRPIRVSVRNSVNQN